MHLSDIQTLFDYNYATSKRILDTAAQVSQEQLFAPAAFPQGSLGDTLIHMLWAEWVWRMRAQEGVSPTQRFTAQEMPTLDSIRARCEEEEQHMRAFLSSLSDKDMARQVSYTTSRGTTHTSTLWHILVHVVNHGTQHRTEAATILTDLGYSPGDIDFIFFVREQQK